MKRSMTMLLGAVLSLFSVAVVTAQETQEENKLRFIFGPRVGFMYVAAPGDEFNQKIQNVWLNSDVSYNKFLTLFGVSLEQRIKLGSTQSHFAFQEVLTLGGLDQGIYLPSASFLIGFRSHAGLEIGLGPSFSLSGSGGSLVGVSVLYAAGWTFSFADVYVPVNIVVDPTPRDGFPRVALVTGFNF